MLEQTGSSVVYRGGEGLSVFPVPFPFLANSHLRVRICPAGGEWRGLAQGADYAVNLLSDGYGELILLHEELPAGALLDIRRRVPLTQEILFHNQGPNSPRATEEALDKLTMIAQQLQDGIDSRLAAPEGSDAAELVDALVGSSARLAGLDASVAALNAGKADAGHVHALSSVNGLADALAGKAAAGHVHALAGVSGLTEQLAGKAASGHAHDIAGVSGLETALAAKADARAVAEALAAKIDSDDPRLTAAEPAGHAASHAADGSDPLAPAAIGAMTPPPSDGKTYLGVAGGWVEYIAPAAGSGEGQGGAGDHSQLLNRDAPDQHPQSAVRNLPADLETIRQSLADLADSDSALAASLLEKADASRLPGPAAADADGLMSAGDKAKLSALPEAAALSSRLDGLETATAGLSDAAASASAAAAQAAARLDGLEESVGGIASGLGEFAAVDDAPADGASYLRRNGEWVVHAASGESGSGESEGGSGGSPSGGGAYLGEIRLFPFRLADFPPGWYLCNGDRFTKAAPQYALLSKLSDAYRADWGMIMNAAMADLPNLTIANSCFFRSVAEADGVGAARNWGADSAGSGFRDYAMNPAIYLGE